MGACCSKPKVQGEEEEEILNKYLITGVVKELSSTCLKCDGERCSQKWYTSSVYTDNKDTPKEDFNIACCKREVRILPQLEHQNIIKFIGIHYKPKNSHPILVTEEVTSNLLFHLDKVEDLQDTEKFKFSCGVSDGLAYLHSQRLAHLNLCTKSIFLTESLEVKITDFEYASYFSDQTRTSSSSSGPTGAKFDPWEFRHDDCVFSFLPPKRYDKYRYESVDIYSFGCVVFNIFTLKQPTVGINSRIQEISVQGVGNIVSKCLLGQIESMQEVSSAINVCSKEHFTVPEKFVQKEKVVEADIEVHKLEKSNQNMNKDTDQDIDQKADVLKSEVEDKAGKTERHDVQLSEAKVDAEKRVECTAAETAIVPVLSLGKPVQSTETPKSEVQTEDKDTQTEDKSVQDRVTQTDDKSVQDKDTQTEDKSVQTDDKQVQAEHKKVPTECKEIAVIPSQGDLKDQVEKLEKEKSDLISRVEELKKKNADLISKLTEHEELSFKFTNAFTTADEGSVIKLRDAYRNLQFNRRPAANRAHKKAYKEIPFPILNHTMLAYEEAKNLALQEFKVVSDRTHSLFELKSPDGNSSQVKRDKAMMQSQQLLESFHDKPMNEKIYQMLINKYKALTNQAPDGKIPKAIDEYYSSLAKFTWDCVARPIPMILNTDAQKFDGDIHETKEGDEGEDGDGSIKGKFVSYIYPVLFTSNSWPREIAMKGKVNVLDQQESVI